MQDIETFKCATIPTPRTPSRSLVLPATPLPDVPKYRAERLHRAQYDELLVHLSPRGFRAVLMLSWLVFLVCWFAFLLIAWRWL